jgi:hypothetical protein
VKQTRSAGGRGGNFTYVELYFQNHFRENVLRVDMPAMQIERFASHRTVQHAFGLNVRGKRPEDHDPTATYQLIRTPLAFRLELDEPLLC